VGYAARGGSQSAWLNGNNRNELNVYGWFDEPSVGNAHPVAKKRPNKMGLYDTAGNGEMCADWYGEYSTSAQMDPIGPRYGYLRVARGGDFGTAHPTCALQHGVHSWPTDRFKVFGVSALCS